MDPASLSLIGTVVGGITSFVGQMSSASAAASQANYQAQVARNNQVIADQNSRYAAAAGEGRAQSQSFKNRAVAGAIEAGQGASGIDLGSPTLEDVRTSAATVGRLDTATIAQEAQLQSRGYSQQGVNYGAQAGLYDMQASNARNAGMIGGFSSLLSSASSFSDKWMRFTDKGVTPFGGL